MGERVGKRHSALSACEGQGCSAKEEKKSHSEFGIGDFESGDEMTIISPKPIDKKELW